MDIIRLEYSYKCKISDYYENGEYPCKWEGNIVIDGCSLSTIYFFKNKYNYTIIPKELFDKINGSVIVEKGEILIKESVFRNMSAEDLRMFMRINDCNDINELKIIQGE